ncbi:MAG: DUF4258 domain-containing protein, partial [candidate division NC10 bacterium]|nr:DUF4258 domain-containing protein [candidate division NC10 bacterium]
EKRRIALQWVKQVLTRPEWIEPDPVDPNLEHRLAPVAEFGNRVLRVVVNGTASPQRVVTAYFDRRRTKS